ncbi:MAG: hypothetical protein NC916_00690 [Candidatus Omnitrophica bacterium]|nr:hypothetical protein [Candidatus Omnitrophota bacterium]
MKSKIFFSLLFSVFSLLFSVEQAQANITLRVVAVNPSEESTQTAPIKVYLPVEVKPEHIVYKDDLEIAYDTQQGSYYVFGEYELKPRDVLEKEIEIKDVWVIEEVEIMNLRKEAKEVFSAFKKTEYADRADAMQQLVENKLKQIEEKQKITSNNPSQHISDYRYSKNLLESAKGDLLAAKTLLSEIRPKGVSALTWKLIIFIIIFLGILGLGFYIIWQRQVKLEQEQEKERDVS